MNNILASQLGKRQAEIYWLHDAEKFEQLSEAATEIYQHLGYNTETAKTVGVLISQAYQLADQAYIAYETGDLKKEIDFYQQVKEKLLSVEKALGITQTIAKVQMKWWMYFRHRKKVKVVINLFLQHLISLGWFNLIAVIQTTYYLVQICRIHKSRDFENTIMYATQYWDILLKLQLKQYPYLG